MPTQKTVTVYTFAELNANAQDAIRDRYRIFAADSFDPDYLVDELEQVLIACGFELDRMRGNARRPAIYYTAERGTYWIAAIAGTWRARRVDHGATARIVNERPQDFKLHSLLATMRSLAMAMPDAQARVECASTYMTTAVAEFWVRDDGTEETPTPDAETTFENCVKDLCAHFAKALEQDYDYRTSDEAIDEDRVMNAPDALYYADGREYEA